MAEVVLLGCRRGELPRTHPPQRPNTPPRKRNPRRRPALGPRAAAGPDPALRSSTLSGAALRRHPRHTPPVEVRHFPSICNTSAPTHLGALNMRKSPTVYCDDEKDNYLVQGWKAPGVGWQAESEVYLEMRDAARGTSRYLEHEASPWLALIRRWSSRARGLSSRNPGRLQQVRERRHSGAPAFGLPQVRTRVGVPEEHVRGRGVLHPRRHRQAQPLGVDVLPPERTVEFALFRDVALAQAEPFTEWWAKYGA